MLPGAGEKCTPQAPAPPPESEPTLFNKLPSGPRDKMQEDAGPGREVNGALGQAGKGRDAGKDAG